MNRYFKISPEWAQKINVTDVAPKHPDGWYMILPTYAMRIIRHLDPKQSGSPWLVEEAVLAIGGCSYTEREALASQRGEEAYMMNRTPDVEQPEEELPAVEPETETETEPEAGTEQPDNGKEANNG